MNNIIDFKERVKNAAIEKARIYKTELIDKEYLIYSKHFTISREYLLASTETNYLHLIGVNSSLSALTFFIKCYQGSLTETDFDFCFKGRNEKEVKGSVRRKITALEELDKLITEGSTVEESFIKNKVTCSITTANAKATLGFSYGKKCRPKSLMKGNELSPSAVKPDLILSRKTGSDRFDKIVVGNMKALKEYLDFSNKTAYPISELLSDELQRYEISKASVFQY